MTDLIPEVIKDKATLRDVAEIFSEATLNVRKLEEERKTISVPLNKALDELMEKTKEAKGPHENVIAAAKVALSGWRSQPQVQESIAKIRRLERDSRQAAKDGDVRAVELIGRNVAELSEECPKAIPVSNGSVRFTERLKLTHIDESELDDRYFVVKRVVDEDRVKEDIELMGSVRGVEHEYSYSPSFYEDKN